MTALVGILNLTLDSFSGDGVQMTRAALARIDAMIADGASVIDIGAESTRPGAQILSHAEEWQRLEPVLSSLGPRLDAVRFSVDTYHVETARKAVALGVKLINDVSGGTNPQMLTLATEQDVTLLCMHSLTLPADPARTIASGADAVEVVLVWAATLLRTLEKSGVERSRVIIDPGIGFGKTAVQSWQLIREIARFKTLGAKLMVGHSRKSFLSLFTDKKFAERDAETCVVSAYLAAQGVDYLRVHDVKSHAAMLRIRRAL